MMAWVTGAVGVVEAGVVNSTGRPAEEGVIIEIGLRAEEVVVAVILRRPGPVEGPARCGGAELLLDASPVRIGGQGDSPAGPP